MGKATFGGCGRFGWLLCGLRGGSKPCATAQRLEQGHVIIPGSEADEPAKESGRPRSSAGGTRGFKTVLSRRQDPCHWMRKQIQGWRSP